MSRIPTQLEADVMIQARDEFRTRASVRKSMGITSASTPAESAAAERRYCQAALKNARDRKDWPETQPKN